MGTRWLYNTPNPGGELTTGDKIYLGTLCIFWLGLIGTIGYIGYRAWL